MVIFMLVVNNKNKMIKAYLNVRKQSTLQLKHYCSSAFFRLIGKKQKIHSNYILTVKLYRREDVVLYANLEVSAALYHSTESLFENLKKITYFLKFSFEA